MTFSRLQTERNRHHRFAEHRRSNYVVRDQFHRRLTSFVLSDSVDPCVITGPSGSGKSALMANWADDFRNHHPHIPIIEHYTDAGESASSPADVMGHIVRELTDLNGVQETEASSDITEGRFRSALQSVRKKTVLVIDGLDQLDADSPDGRIRWLPKTLPQNIRLITTCRDSGMQQLLSRRGWNVLALPPLNVGERRRVVQRFVESRPTDLTSGQQQRVLASVDEEFPLLLRTRLAEAGAASKAGDIDESISYYLGAQSVPELNERLLSRLESEFPPGIVERALTCLQAVSTGLSREELSEIASIDHGEMDRLLRRVDSYVLHIDGRILLYHSSIKEAIQRKWIHGKGRELHRRLALHFQKRPITSGNVHETIRQLRLAGDREKLVEVLIDVPRFRFLIQHRKHELLRCWNELGNQYDVVKSYERALEIESNSVTRPDPSIYIEVGLLFEAAGKIEDAMQKYREAEQIASDLNDEDVAARATVALGKVLSKKGKLDEAEKLLTGSIERLTRLGDEQNAMAATNDLAGLYFYRGDFKKAVDAFLWCRERAVRRGDGKNAARYSGNAGAVMIRVGNLQEAERRLKEMLRHAEESGDVIMESEAVSNLSVLESMNGRLDDAIAYTMRAIRLAEQIGNVVLQMASHGNLGSLYSQMFEPDKAAEHIDEQERLARLLGDTRQLRNALGNRASICIMTRDFEGAERRLDEALELAKTIGSGYRTALVLTTRGFLELKRGRPREAFAAFQRSRHESSKQPNRDLILKTLFGFSQSMAQLRRYRFESGLLERLRTEAVESESQQWEMIATGYLGINSYRSGQLDYSLELLETALDWALDRPLSDHAIEWILTRARAVSEHQDEIASGQDRHTNRAQMSHELDLALASSAAQYDPVLMERVIAARSLLGLSTTPV